MQVARFLAALSRSGKALISVLSVCALCTSITACGGGDKTAPDSSSGLAVAATGPEQASVLTNPSPRKASQKATLRVARDSGGAPQLDSRFSPLGATYQYTPLGWVEEEIEIRVPFKPVDGTTPLLVVAQPNGRWMQVVGARRNGSFMVGRVFQLGYATVVSPRESGPGSRVAALATRVRSLAGNEPDAPVAVMFSPETSPPLPAAEPNVWPKVTSITNLAVDIRYAMPSCSALPALEVIGMTWQGGLQGVRYVNLGRRSLSGTSGLETYRMPLTVAENGNWLFIAYTWCKEEGRQEVTYSMTTYSSKFTVAIDGVASTPPPQVGTHPSDHGVVVGEPAAFSVSVQGQPVAYEWQRSDDGGVTYVTLVGATSSVYTLATTTLADNHALFRVRVSNEGGVAISTPALLTVSPLLLAPSVTSDPSDQNVLEGDSASFSVSGAGQPQPAIQWQQRAQGAAGPEDGWTDIVGATGNSYTVLSSTPAQSGAQFRAVLRNSAGTTVSSAARLTITASQIAPVITTAPVGATVVAGQLGLFNVAATGTTPLSYQWYRNEQPIVGANGSEVLVPALTSDAGSVYQISVRVSNTAGVVISSPVDMRVTLSGTSVSAAQGGEVSGPNDSSLVIPAGSLGSDTTISVEPQSVASADTPRDVVVLGDAVRIQPANLSFLQPAVLQLRAPTDLPVGMTFAVLRLESLEDDGTGNALRASPEANLRRAAGQGVTMLAPRVKSMALTLPATVTCENPQNVSAGGFFRKALNLAGTYATVGVPLSRCTTIQPTTQAEVPSNSDQKCVTDADFWPMTGGNDDELHALVNRHVDCRLGTTFTESLYTELVESNGAYRFPTQSDPPSIIGGYTLGDARFLIKMATFGSYNQLSKRVSVTIETLGFVPNPSYPGPNRTPTIMVQPRFQCGSSTEDSSITPSCTVSGAPVAVNLAGGKATGEFTVAFSWPQRSAPSKDVITFGLYSNRFEWAVQGAPFIQVSGEARYIAPPLGNGILVRCDNSVAKSASRGCVFPNAAAVFVQKLSGDGVDENSAHIAEAIERGAPGGFRMKQGFRAIAADEVRGAALHRTQIDVVRRANRSASCERANSVINSILRMSASCPNGASASCDCDEYPFASTYEGGFFVMPNIPGEAAPNTVSAKYILRSHNRNSGSELGNDFYLKQRVIDLSISTGVAGTPSDPGPAYEKSEGDPFWIHIAR